MHKCITKSIERGTFSQVEVDPSMAFSFGQVRWLKGRVPMGALFHGVPNNMTKPSGP